MVTNAAGTSVVMEPRLIMYHNQAISARLRFFRLQHGGMCVFEPLPTPAAVLEDADAPQHSTNVIAHPSALVAKAEHWLGLPPGSLRVEGGFRETVAAPGGPLTVYLARFTTLDPPFRAAQRVGAAFIALTEARSLASAELELLRRAYQLVMG